MNPLLQQIEKGIESRVSEENQEAYQRTVIAGMKVMFDPKTHQHMELVKNPASRTKPVETIAQGVAGLMWMLFRQSKKSMPYEVLVMAAVTLLMKAADFAENAYGITFTREMINSAVELLAEHLFNKLGIPPEQVAQLIDQAKKGNIQAQGQPAQGQAMQGQEQPMMQQEVPNG